MASYSKTRRRGGRWSAFWRFGRATAWALAVVAAALANGRPGWCQSGLEQDLAQIDDYVWGDWFEITLDRPRPVIHIRLDSDGTFLHGSDKDFALYPMFWRAERITPLARQTLLVAWADRGECAYYVRKIVKDGKEFMSWRPYRDYRDLGVYDGYITRALVRSSRCREMIWARHPDDPLPVGRQRTVPAFP